MSSQEKKMKTTSIMLLPDDLLLSCLARVSRLYYPTLSLLSKSFRSLIDSLEIYKRRSLLGRTESCIYLCLPHDNDLNHRWFTLCRKPDKTLTLNNNNKKSSDHLFVPIPSPIDHAQPSNYVAVGSKIYGIGPETEWSSSMDHEAERLSSSSSKVSVLDCRYNTWDKAPSMRVKRSWYSTASVVDGIIYVAGGSDDESLESIMWFDSKGVWKRVKSIERLPYCRGCKCSKLANYNGNLVGFWDDICYSNDGNHKTMVWCAEISLERCNVDEIWGKIEWFDVVLTIPPSCLLSKAHVLSTNL